MSYLGNSPGVASQRIVTTFTATAGQTTFTPSSGYALGYCDVFLNGVKLVNGDDYTASNGTTVVLASGAGAGDSVEVVAFIPRGLSDGYTKAEADALLAQRLALSGGTMTGGIVTRGGTDTARFNGSLDQPFGNTLRAPANSGRAALIVGKGQPSCWWADDTSGLQVAVGAVDGMTSASGGGLTLWSNNATAWFDGIRLNGGSQAPGSVDLPRQPIIAGQIGTAMTQPVADQLLAFDEFWVSRGVSYNGATRRFTVPIAGIYRITLNPFFASGVAAGRVLIGVNNDSPGASNHYGHAYREATTYDTGCLNSVVTLAANDYIVFRLMQGQLYNQSNDRFNQFSIEKIA